LESKGEGFCLVYTPHTTAALVIAESEGDLMHDYARMAARLLGPSGPFRHCGHGIPNAEAHLFGALCGCSVLATITEDGRLRLGTFQRIILIECDGPRQRKVWISTST